jgi:hypothetical protein
VEQIAELAGEAAFRGYWAPSKEERDRRETPDLAQALMTGLERVCLRADNSLTQAPQHEERIIREFRRRIHHYLPGASLPENSLELIALMQHHGAPTRLLDWTYSPYVAAHFALVHASRRPGADLAIWTIRPEWCRDASRTASIKPQPAALWGRIENPEDGDVTETFLRNITLLPAFAESKLTRYIITHSHSRAVAQSLYRMNVTETTLFPGLDGFARSLWSLPEIPRQGGES